MTRIRKSNPIFNIINSSLTDLPAPSNINSWWNFGSLLGVCLITQILTGLFLAIHFTSDISTAFNRTEHIIRNVNNGWIIRLIHTNGASIFFFLFVPSHVSRDILYFLFLNTNMNNWCNLNNISNRNCLYRICSSMRTDILLRSNSYY